MTMGPPATSLPGSPALNPEVHFSDLAPYISAALEYSGGSHSLEDIRQGLADSQLQCWPGVRSVVITQIQQMPQRKELHLFLAAGDLTELRALYPIIMDWGRAQGCTVATFTGRKGWERTFLTREEGWRSRMILFEKEL